MEGGVGFFNRYAKRKAKVLTFTMWGDIELTFPLELTSCHQNFKTVKGHHPIFKHESYRPYPSIETL